MYPFGQWFVLIEKSFCNNELMTTHDMKLSTYGMDPFAIYIFVIL